MVLRHSGFGRLQAFVFVVAAGYAGVQAGPLLGDSIRGTADTASFAGLALWGIPCLVLLWCAVRSLRQGVTVSAEGLRVRNILASRTIPWSHVGGFSTGPMMAQRPLGGELEWWGVQVLLRDSERMVRIQGSFSRKRARAEAFAAQLRSLAPSGLHTGDSLRAPRSVYPTGDPTGSGRRYVVHSWAINQGGSGGVQTFLTVCVFVAIVVGVILLMDGSAVAGALVLAVSCALVWLLVLSSRPRLVVTSRGLRPGRRRLRPTVIPWSDVRGARVIETANALMTRRVSYLEVLTSSGPVPLWATMRSIHQIDHVCQRVVSYAMRPTP